MYWQTGLIQIRVTVKLSDQGLLYLLEIYHRSNSFAYTIFRLFFSAKEVDENALGIRFPT